MRQCLFSSSCSCCCLFIFFSARICLMCICRLLFFSSSLKNGLNQKRELRKIRRSYWNDECISVSRLRTHIAVYSKRHMCVNEWMYGWRREQQQQQQPTDEHMFVCHIKMPKLTDRTSWGEKCHYMHAIHIHALALSRLSFLHLCVRTDVVICACFRSSCSS